MLTNNPWQVESIDAFSFLKCPECNFDTKEEFIFQDHAIVNHPLSFVLFGKTCKEEEEDYDPILDPDLEDIKQELPDTNGSNDSEYVEKSSNSEEKLHTCSTCNESFSQPYKLKKHVELIHENKRSFGCSECDLKFKLKHHLKRHFSAVHVGKEFVDSTVKEEESLNETLNEQGDISEQDPTI